MTISQVFVKAGFIWAPGMGWALVGWQEEHFAANWVVGGTVSNLLCLWKRVSSLFPLLVGSHIGILSKSGAPFISSCPCVHSSHPLWTLPSHVIPENLPWAYHRSESYFTC